MIKVFSVSGPLVKARIDKGAKIPKMMETVFVGDNRLLGEVISINGDTCSIQVYEETTGVCVGEVVELTGELLTVELGPGLIGSIFDGIQRPLEEIDKVSPIFIPSGLHLPALNREKVWEYSPVKKSGDELNEGDVLGIVPETSMVEHKILVPMKEVLISEHKKDIKFPLKVIKNDAGSFTLKDKCIEVTDANDFKFNLGLSHKWPVKQARPVNEKIPATELFKTGQRVIDGFFPILLGSSVSSPGPFGAGKTFTQQQIAKWSDAQIVVYVGCGERGNEMAEMVNLFPTLKDPISGKPLMDRTVVVANTSNMPIAAREASIYTGISIAEYYRDMGYNVVLMADSTSRWAEAMREISARLGELPAEQGYPAYLSSRLSSFYSRAGQAILKNGEHGSVTVIGTVSPAGGDFSDPVVQVSLKNNEVFLGLDADLAAKRHYPAINWNLSYSLNEDKIRMDAKKYYSDGLDFVNNIRDAKAILEKEESLLNLVKLVGLDGLSYNDRVLIEIGRSIREDYLQQNGFDESDTYCTPEKMQLMLKMIMDLYEKANEILSKHEDPDIAVKQIFSDEVRELLSNAKYTMDISVIQDKIDKINNLIESI